MYINVRFDRVTSAAMTAAREILCTRDDHGFLSTKLIGTALIFQPSSEINGGRVRYSSARWALYIHMISHRDVIHAARIATRSRHRSIRVYTADGYAEQAARMMQAILHGRKVTPGTVAAIGIAQDAMRIASMFRHDASHDIAMAARNLVAEIVTLWGPAGLAALILGADPDLQYLFFDALMGRHIDVDLNEILHGYRTDLTMNPPIGTRMIRKPFDGLRRIFLPRIMAVNDTTVQTTPTWYQYAQIAASGLQMPWFHVADLDPGGFRDIVLERSAERTRWFEFRRGDVVRFAEVEEHIAHLWESAP